LAQFDKAIEKWHAAMKVAQSMADKQRRDDYVFELTNRRMCGLASEFIEKNRLDDAKAIYLEELDYSFKNDSLKNPANAGGGESCRDIGRLAEKYTHSRNYSSGEHLLQSVLAEALAHGEVGRNAERDVSLELADFYLKAHEIKKADFAFNAFMSMATKVADRRNRILGEGMRRYARSLAKWGFSKRSEVLVAQASRVEEGTQSVRSIMHVRDISPEDLLAKLEHPSD
jgi:hypothetical protein